MEFSHILTWFERFFTDGMTWYNYKREWDRVYLTPGSHWTCWVPMRYDYVPDREFWITYALGRMEYGFDVTDILFLELAPKHIVARDSRMAWVKAAEQELKDGAHMVRRDYDECFTRWREILVDHIPAEKITESMHPITPAECFDMKDIGQRMIFMHPFNWAPCATGTISREKAHELAAQFKY